MSAEREGARKTVSFIFPVFNEEANLTRLHSTLRDALDAIAAVYDFEIIFVNDGSRDGSLRVIRDLVAADPDCSLIDLSRNFGHQVAVTAGLDFARGDAVIVMDSDLQDPPLVAVQLIDRWERGADVVYATRRSRRDSFFKRVTAAVYYRALAALADVDIPRNTGDFRLLSRRVVNELKRYREHNRFLRGLVSYVGFRQESVEFDRDARFAGVTGYPLTKMLRFAADGILGFSTAPLRLIRNFGILVATMSFAGVVYALVVKMFFPRTVVDGWTFTVISVLFVGGVQLLSLSILGSYIGRIYRQVQDRPLYSVADVEGALAGKRDGPR